jgi:hypothetical protein
MMLAAAALVLQGSTCSTVDPEKPAPVIRTVYVKPKMPAAAKVPCAAPLKLPARRLTDKETTDDWGADRASLRICEQRRKAAVAAGE